MFTYQRILDLVVSWAEDALPQQVLDPTRDDDGAFIAGGWCLWEVRGIPAPDVSNFERRKTSTLVKNVPKVSEVTWPTYRTRAKSLLLPLDA